MIRLTRKRLARLNEAISVDDILYEKFRRMNADLSKREHRFAARKQIAAVYLRKNNIRIAMKIMAVHNTGNGLVVEIQ
jgi:hypothetical protein